MTSVEFPILKISIFKRKEWGGHVGDRVTFPLQLLKSEGQELKTH